MSLNLLNDERTSVPPSVSKVRVNTSVVTTRRSLVAAGVTAGAPVGTPTAVAVVAPTGVGTDADDGPPTGTDTADAPDAAGPAAGAFAVLDTLLVLGKKVGFWPLKTCH